MTRVATWRNEVVLLWEQTDQGKVSGELKSRHHRFQFGVLQQ